MFSTPFASVLPPTPSLYTYVYIYIDFMYTSDVLPSLSSYLYQLKSRAFCVYVYIISFFFSSIFSLYIILTNQFFFSFSHVLFIFIIIYLSWERYCIYYKNTHQSQYSGRIIKYTIEVNIYFTWKIYQYKIETHRGSLSDSRAVFNNSLHWRQMFIENSYVRWKIASII